MLITWTPRKGPVNHNCVVPIKYSQITSDFDKISSGLVIFETISDCNQFTGVFCGLFVSDGHFYINSDCVKVLERTPLN